MRRSSVFLLLLFLFFTRGFIGCTTRFCQPVRCVCRLLVSKLAEAKPVAERLSHAVRRERSDMGGDRRIDFSYFTGNSTLHTSDLNSTQLAKLAPIAPLLPPGFVICSHHTMPPLTRSPEGPQFSIRKFKAITIFVRPSDRSNARERNRKSTECDHGANRQ